MSADPDLGKLRKKSAFSSQKEPRQISHGVKDTDDDYPVASLLIKDEVFFEAADCFANGSRRACESRVVSRSPGF